MVQEVDDVWVGWWAYLAEIVVLLFVCGGRATLEEVHTDEHGVFDEVWAGDLVVVQEGILLWVSTLPHLVGVGDHLLSVDGMLEPELD